MKKFFRCLFRIQNRKQNSVQKSILLLSVSMFQLLINISSLYLFQLNRELEMRNMFYGTETSTFSTIIKFLIYVDVENVCQQQLVVIALLLLAGFFYPVVYLFILMLSSDSNISTGKDSFAIKVIGSLADIYYWCLFSLFFQIQIETLLLNSQVIDWAQISSNHSVIYFFLIFLSILGVILNISMVTLVIVLFYHNIHSKCDLLSCQNTQIMRNLLLCKIIIIFFDSLQIQSSFQYLAYLLVFDCLFAKLIYDQFFGKGQPSFQSSFVNYIYQHYLFSFFSIIFALLLQLLFKQLKQEVDEIILILIFLSICNALGARLEDRIVTYYLLQNTNTSSNVLNKLYYFNILCKKKPYHSQVVIGIILNHLSKGCITKAERKYLYLNDRREGRYCNDSIEYCYCQQLQFYDAKRKLYINSNQKNVNLNYKSFCKIEVKSWYEQFLLQVNDCNTIRLQYAYYLLLTIKNKSLALRQFSIINEKQDSLSFLEKIKFHLMMMDVKIQINQENDQSYRGRLKFENLIQLEKAVSAIKVKIVDIISYYLKFWKCLNSEEIIEEELNKWDNKITKNVDECEGYWNVLTHNSNNETDQHLTSYLNRKPQWELLYLWYRRYILNQKLKNEIVGYHNYSHLQQNFIDEDSDSDYEANALISLDTKKIFTPQTAIIFSQENGKIFQQNDYARQIFGISALQNINQLIHPTMVRNHMYRIKEFMQRGKSCSLYSRRKILFIHQNSHLMQANKYLKLSVNQHMSLNFVAMVRPITHEQSGNYILLNEDWEIEETTKQLKSVLQKQFNLLLYCPKLLLYSPYKQLLEKEDYQLFQIKPLELSYLQYQHTLENLKTLLQQKTLMDNIFDDNDQEKQFTEQFIKEHEDDLDERQRIFNANIANKNEQYFYLLMKIPMLFQRMQAEYFNLITNGEKENFYDFPEDSIIKTQSVICKSQNNKKCLLIDFKILNQKLRFLKNIKLNTQLDTFRYLYKKYCSRPEQLKKVIRLEAKIKYETQKQIDKIQILKINRFETFNNIKSKKSSMLLKGDMNRKTQKIQLPFKLSLPLQQFPSQKEITTPPTQEAHSITDQQYLVNEANIREDFMDQNKQNYQLEPDQNLFIKEEHNKLKKHFSKINYFKWTNRYFMIGMIILTMTSFSYGPNMNYQNLFKMGASSSYASVLMQLGISIIYNQLVDVALCNNTQLFCSNLRSYTELQNEIQGQITLVIEDIKNIILEHRSIYEDKENIKVIYSITVLNHDGQVHPENLLEDIEMFQVVLQQFMLADKSQISFDFEYLQIMQADLMPGLFESLSFIQTDQLNQIMSEFEFRQSFFLLDMIGGFVFLGALMGINTYYIFLINNHYQMLHCQVQYFDQQVIDSILRYYQRLKQYFNYINDIHTCQLSNYVSFQSEGLIKVEEDHQVILAVKSTKFKQGSFWLEKKVKLIFLYFLFMMLLIVMALTYNIYMQKFAYDLKIQLTQNPFLKIIYNPWAFIFSKELYIESFFDIHHIVSEEYQEYLQDFINEALQDKSEIYSSNLQQIEKYFYSDICQLLNINSSKCDNIADGVLKRGLPQVYQQIGTFFQSQLNSNLTTIQDVSFESIYHLNTVLLSFNNQLQPYLFQVQKNVWKIWIDNFDEIFQYYSQTEIQLIVCFYVFSFLIYITTLEIYFEKKLCQDYRQVKEFYKRFFPNEVLNQQKRVKGLLKRVGFL